MFDIYSKHALEPPFRTTMYSAMVLILLPSLTNVYFTFKPNATLARVLPLAMPLVCLAQYYMAFRYDLENFCFLDSDDSALMRQKYITLKRVELPDISIDKIEREIQAF